MIAAIFCSCLTRVGGQTEAKPAPQSPIGITVKADKTTVHSGENPGIHVQLKNTTKEIMHLVLPNDGSWAHWSNPKSGWSILSDPTAKQPVDTPQYVGGRCGNVNPLEVQQFFDLKPGQTKEIGWAWVPLIYPGTGTFRIAFYFENDSKLSNGAGRVEFADDEAKTLYKNLTPVKGHSNEVKITILP